MGFHRHGSECEYHVWWLGLRCLCDYRVLVFLHQCCIVVEGGVKGCGEGVLLIHRVEMRFGIILSARLGDVD